MGFFGLFRRRRKKTKLTTKQRAQRQYASEMKQVRSRTAKRTGGSGRVAKRSSARTLRRKYGLKSAPKRKSRR